MNKRPNVFRILVCLLTLISANTLTAQLYINELMAKNESTIADEAEEYDDWIEIYNAGPTAIDLAGYYMSDDPANPNLWQIPSTNFVKTTVPANGFLILWADKDTDQGENHLDFKLSSDGETIQLYQTDGQTLIDEISYTGMDDDQSYGRTSDGSTEFNFIPNPTPGTSNTAFVYPTSYPAFFDIPIIQGSDDAKEANDVVDIDRYDLQIVETWIPQTVGLRFQNLDIPAGAIVTRAYIQFTTSQFSSDDCNLLIQGEATANPTTFIEVDNNISSRPRTEAEVAWQPAAWNILEEHGEAQRTPDLSTIVQEQIDLPDWENNNSIVFLFTGTGKRRAMAFDGISSMAARLIIEVELPINPSNITSIEINEVASKGTDFTDEAGDFEDWIELYNSSNTPVNIGGMYLTDDLNNPIKWQIAFPEIIPANGHIVIFADKDPEEGYLHTNFSLSKNETIALIQIINNEPVIVDSVTIGSIPFKTSYGRIVDGSSNWINFAEITPGASNNGAGRWTAPPEISLTNGVYSEAQTLTLSHPINGVDIRYTMDGSEPNEFSPLYSEELTIDDNTSLRAKAFRSGNFWPSQDAVGSFLINVNHNLPIFHINTDPKNFFDDEIGIYVVGTNGVPGFCRDEPRNFAHENWERPVNISFYETDGSEAFNVNAGVQIGGACSRNSAMKSLNFYLRNSTYGDEFIDYKIFDIRDHGKFNRFKLRNSGQDFTRMGFRDAAVQSLLWNVVDLETQAYRPAVMYINGEFWGIHNIRENYNDEYFEGNYGIDKDDIDLIKNPGLPWIEIKKGDTIAYQSLYRYFENNDVSQQTHYDYVESQMDMNEFLNYQIAFIYTANYDWPANNSIAWRERKEGAKWRWCALDTDGSTNNGLDQFQRGEAEYNTLATSLDDTSETWPNHKNSTLMFRKLLENTAFRDEFAQRNCSFMELVFHTDRVNHFVDSLKSKLEPDMTAHIAKWGFDNAVGSSMFTWNQWIGAFKDFFVERPDYMTGFLQEAFGLSDRYELHLNYDENTEGTVVVNWNEMATPYNFRGSYFKNIPLRIKAIAKPGFIFSHWLETGDTNPQIDFVGTSNSTLTPVFEANSFPISLGNNQILCEGASYIIDATVDNCDDCVYLWSDDNEEPVREVTPDETTTYAITVTRPDGAVGTDEITITVIQEEVIEYELSTIDCYGENSGAIDILNGGDGYSYEWSNGAESQDVSELFAGTYDIILTDPNDCISTASISVTQRPDIIIGNEKTDVDCNGFATGSIDLQVNGGTGAYFYSWNNGASEEDLSGLVADTYIVEIRDENNCLKTKEIIITEPTAIVIDKDVTSVALGNDGAISVNPTGGVPPYMASWDDGAIGFEREGLAIGTYTITVIDANDCEYTETIEVGITAINEIESLQSFQLYPNPTAGHFVIDLNFDKIQSTQISIIDVLGRTVKTINDIGQIIVRPIDVSDQTNGFYFIEVQTEEGRAVKKILLER